MRIEDEIALNYERLLANKILAIEVKGPGDQPRKEQRETITRLQQSGLQADFLFTKTKKARRPFVRYTREQKLTQDAAYFSLGYGDFQRGINDPPKPEIGARYGGAWYRLRSEWKRGWEQAQFEVSKK